MSLRMSSPAALALSALAIVALSVPATSQSPRSLFHPNSEKYSDAGEKPASGRSGSASLEARALYGKDGVTLLEATTGSFEAGTTSGTLRKIQLKVFSTTNALQYTDNVNGLSAGVWSTEMPGMARNQRIQLQANIGGVDGNRNDVVTVTTLVKRRPDLAVTGVTVPSKAYPRAPVNVAATVSELNGDVGARATCVLSVDGASVLDQATGIWVDAGHTVSCAFRTSFTTIGTHQVQVYVTGIAPTDWDASNNSATTSIEIVSPEKPLSYSAQFGADDYNYYSHLKVTYADGTVQTETSESGTRANRALSLNAWTASNTFAFPTSVRTALATNGSSVFDATNGVAIQPDASWDGADCGAVYQPGYSVTVCNWHYGTLMQSEVDLSSYAGRVTYFGNSYRTIGWVGYASNSADNTTGYGGYALGPTVSPIIELTDANGIKFVARPTLTLQPSPINESWNSCGRNPRTGVTTCSDGYSKGTHNSAKASAQ